MKQKEIEQWSTVRQKGRTRYILLNGMLGWGLFMFVAMNFLVNRGSKEPAMLLVSLAVWMAGGALFGYTNWVMSEKRYQKAVDER